MHIQNYLNYDYLYTQTNEKVIKTNEMKGKYLKANYCDYYY